MLLLRHNYGIVNATSDTTHTHTPCTLDTQIHSYSPPHQSPEGSLSDKSWSLFSHPSARPLEVWWLSLLHPPWYCSDTELLRDVRLMFLGVCPLLDSQCRPSQRLEGIALSDLKSWKIPSHLNPLNQKDILNEDTSPFNYTCRTLVYGSRLHRELTTWHALKWEHKRLHCDLLACSDTNHSS